MYSLKTDDYFTNTLAENTSPNYTIPLNNFDETNDQLANQVTTLSGKINATNDRFIKFTADATSTLPFHRASETSVYK
jgi:hypothetical protein